MEDNEIESLLKDKMKNNNTQSNLQEEGILKSSQNTLHTPLSTPSSSFNPKEFVVLANKEYYGKASMSVHGCLTNGGEIPFNDQYSLAFIKTGANHVSIQLRVYNKGNAPLKQSYVRTKKVKVKAEPKKEEPEVEFKENTEEGSTW